MIWISQWLCPKRHCSLAMMWNPDGTTPGEIEAQGENIYTDGALIRDCALCGGDLEVEHRPTLFQTMEEAERAGRILEAQQLRLRAQILGSRN